MTEHENRVAVECLKLAVEIRRLANMLRKKKQMDIFERFINKRFCFICEDLHRETWECDKCGHIVCGDHIVNVGNDTDNPMNRCIDCLEDKDES